MKRKISLLSIALITAGFLAATAQNHIPLNEKYERKNASFEYPGFEKPQLPVIKKPNSGQDRWEPDTITTALVIDKLLKKERRFVFKYNSQGLLKERIEQWWRDNSWIDGSSITYTYYSNNNLLSAGGDIYTYDSNNNMLTHLQRYWTNDSWENHSLITYTYDSNNNTLTKLSESWTNNSWVKSYLLTYTYDSDNNLLTEMDKNWINNSWKNSINYIYTYDSNNNILTVSQQMWLDNSWTNSNLRTYTYDSNNNMLTMLFQGGQGNDSSLNIQLDTYTYDSGNNMLTYLHQDWSDNSWKNSYMITYAYDSNDNMLTEQWQWWHNNSWQNSYQYQYRRTYDENMNGTSVEFLKWSEGSWYPENEADRGYLKLYYNNMQNNFGYKYFHKMTASYIKVPGSGTAISEPPATSELNAISISPNPTTGKLRIDNYDLRIYDLRIYDLRIYDLRIKDIQIFDISGVQLFSTQQTTLDVSHLPAGIYFVQIKTEKGIVTKKIVKL